MDRQELVRRLVELATEADEAGLDTAATALLLLARCASLPNRVTRRLANTAHMLLDTVVEAQ